MEQTVAHARMEQQLYGGTSRGREEDCRVIATKAAGPRPEDAEGGGAGGSSGRRKRSSSDGRRRAERQGMLRGLFFNIIRSRLGDSAASDSPRSPEAIIRREGSMHLPRPAECTMPGETPQPPAAPQHARLRRPTAAPAPLAARGGP
jgi:hypothetical protein